MIKHVFNCDICGCEVLEKNIYSLKINSFSGRRYKDWNHVCIKCKDVIVNLITDIKHNGHDSKS